MLAEDCSLDSHISVGMPVYNDAAYIGRTIDSVLLNYDDIDEIIISDNCSTDGTYEVLQRYASEYSKIKLFRQADNMGAFFNFKFVLEKASNGLFAWVGSHDIISKKYFYNLKQVINLNDEYVVAFPNSKYDEKNNIVVNNSYRKDFLDGVCSSKKTDRIKAHFRSPQVMPIHGLIRTTVLKKYFLNIPVMLGGDHYLLRCLLSDGMFACVGDVQYVRNHPHVNDDRVGRYEKSLGSNFTHRNVLAKTFQQKTMNFINELDVSWASKIHLKCIYFYFYYLRPHINSLKSYILGLVKMFRGVFWYSKK